MSLERGNGRGSELLNLPKEMIKIEINKWLLELDRQLLRKVSKYFNDMFPFIFINFNEIDLQVVHLQHYKKLWNKDTLPNIARWGRLESLQFALEDGSDGDIKGKGDYLITSNAAKYGHLECLKYACSQGYPWNNITTAYAALGGHLECLKYLHRGDGTAQGCPWDWLTPAYAAWGGHLDCLKYAHENGCEWDCLTFKAAVGSNQQECLKYLKENGMSN